MPTSQVDNEIEVLFANLIRFFIMNRMVDMNVNVYKENKDFGGDIKKVMKEVKRLLNIIIDDQLEDCSAYYLDARKFLESNNAVEKN